MKRTKVLILLVVVVGFFSGWSMLKHNNAVLSAPIERQSLKQNYFKEHHHFKFSSREYLHQNVSRLSRYNLLSSSGEINTKTKLISTSAAKVCAGTFINQTELSVGTYKLYLYSKKLAKNNLKQLRLIIHYSDGTVLSLSDFDQGEGYLSKTVKLNKTGQIGFQYNTRENKNALVLNGYGILGQ